MSLPTVKTLDDIYNYYKSNFVIIPYNDVICHRIYDFMLSNFTVRIYYLNNTYMIHVDYISNNKYYQYKSINQAFNKLDEILNYILSNLLQLEEEYL